MRILFHFFIDHFPKIKRTLKSIVLHRMSALGISSHYTQIQANDIQSESNRLRDAWLSKDIPIKQRELVDASLATYLKHESVDVFDTMVRALQQLPLQLRDRTVLEIGCSSGYYAEVFAIAGLGFKYRGCDYSGAFIELAHEKYPEISFDVEDATALTYGNDAFDIAISGCCLLHIPEYEAAIAETARVTRCYAIFHRTPVVLGQPNQYYRKQGYGVEMVEIHFNEPEFLELLKRHGLELIATYTLHESVKENAGSACRTYVCKKK